MEPKQLLTIISFTFLVASTTAQNYFPFIEKGRQTTIEYKMVPTLPQSEGEIQYYFSKDTVINGLIYSILSAKHLFGNYTFFGNEGVVAVMREDTINGQVYLSPILPGDSIYGANQEFLLWDYSLDIGDSIEVFDFYSKGLTWVTIDSLSDLSLNNGKLVKQFWGDIGRIGWRRVLYTEGIYNGAVRPEHVKCGYCLMFDICVWDSTINTIWSNGICSTSNYVGQKEEFMAQINFQNPASDVFNVQLKEEGTIYLYNTNGTLVLEERVVEGINSLDVSFLPIGIYIIRFQSVRGYRFSKLLIE